MWMVVYHLLWTVALLFLAPVAWALCLGARGRRDLPDPGARLAARLAWRLPDPPPRKGAIWVHALSVGEVLSALPLVQRLNREFPQKGIVFTATTATGVAMARERLREGVEVVFPMPLDAWWSVQRVINGVRPSIFILVETDIWPGLLTCLRHKGIRSILVNGRISPRTLHAYQRARFLVRRMFDPLDVCLMQSDLDRDRLLMIGIDPRKVITTGNIKFDQQTVAMREEERRGWLCALGLEAKDLVWIAGSTHPGEEEIVLDVFKRLLPDFSRLRLILAPRDTGRSGHLVIMAEEKGLRAVQRTQVAVKTTRNGEEGAGSDPIETPRSPSSVRSGRLSFDVLVLDTMGELGRIYGLASVCFVGGSLVPIGGHNLLEPAGFGIPVVFGPHTHNFVSMSLALLESGGGRRVRDGDGLYETLKAYLEDEEVRLREGARARTFVESNRGAIEKVLDHVKHGLGQAG